MGILEGTTRILCTHQSKYAVGSAQVIVLDRDGGAALVNANKHELPEDGGSDVDDAPPARLPAMAPTSWAEGKVDGVVSARDDAVGVAESKFTGSLKNSVFLRYLRASGSWARVFFVATLFVGAQVLQVVAELSLGRYLPEDAEEGETGDRDEFQLYTILLSAFIAVALARGLFFTNSASKPHIITSLPFFKMVPKSRFEMCFAPPGAGHKKRLESRIKEFKPHFVYDYCFRRPSIRHKNSTTMRFTAPWGQVYGSLTRSQWAVFSTGSAKI